MYNLSISTSSYLVNINNDRVSNEFVGVHIYSILSESGEGRRNETMSNLEVKKEKRHGKRALYFFYFLCFMCVKVHFLINFLP